MITKNLAAFIDHTNLKPDADEAAIRFLCEEARENSFKAVCVAPLWVRSAVIFLEGSQVSVCTVVGFPLGYNTSNVKSAEAERAIAEGAREIDMVIPVGLLKAGQLPLVGKDIEAVVRGTKKEVADALVKVIIECCYLDELQKEQACRLAMEAGADFVKTSTGFGIGGATIEDVQLMRRVVGDKLGVKAAGGVRTTDQTLAMIEAGANRIGTSNGVAILRGLQQV